MIVTAVSLVLTAVFVFGSISKRRALESVSSTQVVVPMDDFEMLEPSRRFYSDEPDSAVRYRYVVYFDSSHCSSCEMKGLVSWNEVIGMADDAGVGMEFLFVFSPKPNAVEEFRQSYRASHFLRPVYVDSEGTMLKMNPLMAKIPGLRIFILDSAGKICFTGDPSRDSASYDKYMAFLQKVKENNARGIIETD